ncbi:MAG: hypothetical protein ACJA1E_001405, partial [Paracoccaceae bacterium]
MRWLVVAAVCLWQGAATAGEIEESGLDNLPHAQITLLGENHDNAGHHLGQARALRAIAPRAVVLEMLTPEQAARVTPELLS